MFDVRGLAVGMAGKLNESGCGYMSVALELAEAAAACGEVPVGAVVVDSRNGAILARAHNRVKELGDATAHAEMLVLRKAMQVLQVSRLVHCDLYVTLEPCVMCAGAVSLARIRRLYFGAADSKGGGVEHGARIFGRANCNHAPEIYGGIGARRAEELLLRFFVNLRQLPV